MPTKTNPALSGNQPRIFLSYARKDGEDFARDLRKRLTEPEDPGQVKFSLWQDRTQMEGGKDWWDQILEALKHVEYMVLVMTEASLASPIVRKEWRQARQEGVGVIPVFGQPDLDLSKLPRWMRDVHWVNTDVPEQWTRFIRTLESPHQGTRVPFMADDLPPGYVPRLKEFEELAGSLLDPEQEEPIAITAALKGAGGYGKTILAKALCHDERIQDAFHDGILWVTLGEQPNTMAGLTKLYAALTEERPNFVDEEDASAGLAEVLGDKDCLMVIDDVWNAAHLRPFLRGGKRCARIITTRDSTTLPETARLRVPVDAMQQKEALALLAFDLPTNDLPDEETVALQSLAARLGEWPFLLKLANGVLRERVNRMGQSLADALTFVQKALEKPGLTAFDARNPVERDQAVAITLGASFEHLKENELVRYQELAIFPEDEEVPLTAVTKLWTATGGLDDFDTDELCTRLNQLSLLLGYDLTTQRIQLHDVVRTYLEEQVASQLPGLHGTFLDACSLQDGPVKAAQDPYLCRHLAYHLVKAERWEELKNLLLNIDWLYAKLEALDVPALLSDFDWIQSEKTFSLVQGAIRLSAHIVGKDPKQLVEQLLGRLQTIQYPEIQKLVETGKQWKTNPWLRPIQGSLTAPGGALLRTLSGHTGDVNAVAVTADGQRAISGAEDGLCKVWDLDSGEEVYILPGHDGRVTAVAITADGRRAISGAADGTCTVWDLDNGKVLRTLPGHKRFVDAVAVTADGRWAITGGKDDTCKVWDLDSGKEVHNLLGHVDWVKAVGITADGRRAISVGHFGEYKVWDLDSGRELQTPHVPIQGMVQTVAVTSDGLRAIASAGGWLCKVWDMDSGEELQTLPEHFRLVSDKVVITADGKRAISVALNGTCKVWDLGNGEEVHSLRWPTIGWMKSGPVPFAVTADGKRAISVAENGTCKVWDLSSGEDEDTLHGHSDRVMGFAVTADGLRAISASRDHTCKVWDLGRGKELKTLRGHRGWVWAVAVTADGQRAISGAGDDTCKVWDLGSGDEVHTLCANNNTWVRAVAVTPDGQRAIAGSDDGLCKVWDLNSGKELHTLHGHRGWVWAVAVTPDGQRAISGSADGTCKVWDLGSGKELQTLRGHSYEVRAVAVVMDGWRAISAAEDGTCKVWDLRSGKEEHTLRGHSNRVRAVAVTPDGRRAISVAGDDSCIVWDIDSGEKLHTLPGRSGRVRAISAVDDGTCTVWDLTSGEEVATFTGESGFFCCAVSPDGRTMVVGESSGRVHFLRLEGID